MYLQAEIDLNLNPLIDLRLSQRITIRILQFILQIPTCTNLISLATISCLAQSGVVQIGSPLFFDFTLHFEVIFLVFLSTLQTTGFPVFIVLSLQFVQVLIPVDIVTDWKAPNYFKRPDVLGTY